MSLERHNLIKGFFVCDRCREVCQNGKDQSGLYGPDVCPKEYSYRKKEISCLGEFCDEPCHLQKETDLTLGVVVELLKYLLIEVNKHVMAVSKHNVKRDLEAIID